MSGASNDLAKLIAEVQHQTNNSLMAILGFVDLLLARNDLPEPVMAKLRHVKAEALKIEKDIARIPSTGRPGA
jgi:signal transduction histidine kinase